jgi:hypothetical protein
MPAADEMHGEKMPAAEEGPAAEERPEMTAERDD